MKTIAKSLTAILLAMAFLAVPLTTDARGRNEKKENKSSFIAKKERPGNMGRPQNNNNHRPASGNNDRVHGGSHNQQRPSFPLVQNHNKPSNNKHHNNNSHPGKHDNGNHYGHYHRPNMPPYYSWHRPTPPRHWRPAHNWRPFHTILGITFGTALNASINLLLNQGYAVSSYGNNVVYLTNAPMLNLNWPDAMMFYNGGGLCGSRFIYSTSFYDMSRYNMAYASLVNGYGSPISVQNTASGLEATWWGTGNQFIRLAFNSDYAQNGSLRYFTTLSFGN